MLRFIRPSAWVLRRSTLRQIREGIRRGDTVITIKHPPLLFAAAMAADLVAIGVLALLPWVL